MKIQKGLILLLVLYAFSVYCQVDEIFINKAVYKQAKPNDPSYFQINLDEKIPDLELTIIAIGIDKYNEPEIQLFIAEQGEDYQKATQRSPNYTCSRAQNNFCIIPEKDIVFQEKFTIYVKISCDLQCSYSLEASYTKMRQFFIDTSFQYRKYAQDYNEQMTSLSGWFNVPKDKNIIQVRISVYEFFANSQALPITILMNPGKEGVSGNDAKYKSDIGVLNSAIITLQEKDLKTSDNFSFLVLFPYHSPIIIKIESYDGGIAKLPINSFTQYEQNVNENMIFQIVNPAESPERVDPTNKSLVINILSQEGYGLISLAGNKIPQQDSDYILSTREHIFEQKLVLTSQMRKDHNLGDDLFYLQVKPISGRMIYLIEVGYEFENQLQIQDLEFNIQSHYVLEANKANHYRLILPGNYTFQIDLKIVQKEGKSAVLVKNCSKQLANCTLSDEQVATIVKDQQYLSQDVDIIKYSENSEFHYISYQSDPNKCNNKNGYILCIYYIAVINYDKQDVRYMMLAEHSQITTKIKDNEIYYGGILPNQYKYYEYQVPSKAIESNPIEYVKIVLNSPSQKAVIGANISSKSQSNRPNINSVDVFQNSNFLLIRQQEFGELSGQKINFFIYSDEFTIYNVHVTYHASNETLKMKYLVLNNKITDVLDSYESRGLYRVFLWLQQDFRSDLKIELKAIEGQFYFQYCQKEQDNQLLDCIQSQNNKLVIPLSQIKENILLSYVQVIPQIMPGAVPQSHQTLQYSLGMYLSYYVVELEKNRVHSFQLKLDEFQYYKINISQGDLVKLQMTSDNETIEGMNAIAYISFDQFQQYKPNPENYNQTLYENQLISIDEQQTQQICEKPAKLGINCYITLMFTAKNKNTQITFSAFNVNHYIQLNEFMVHKQEYPDQKDSYQKYFYHAKRNSTAFLETFSPLAELEIYINFIHVNKIFLNYTKIDSLYPTKSQHHYQVRQTGDPYLKTLQFENNLMDTKNSDCKDQKECLYLISIKIADEYYEKNFKDEYYRVKMFNQEILIQSNQRTLYQIRKDQNLYFKFSIDPKEKRYIIHVNPIGICDVETIVLKMGQQQQYSFTEKGGSLIIIDQDNVFEDKQVQGDYLATVSTQDIFCQFYFVAYGTSYQYVKVEAGHYFHTNLEINQQLFLEYQDNSPSSFRVEASVEEGSIKMGVESEKYIIQWNPQKPIIQYALNNLKDTRRHTIFWDKEKHPSCSRCKYIIAVSAIRETSLSIVVKNDETYTTLPAQRMFRVESLNNTVDLFHFYPHSQKFSLQVTLITGTIYVYGNKGLSITPSTFNALFNLFSVYTSQEVTFTPQTYGPDDNPEENHSKPYSFAVKSMKDSVYVISFQSNDKIMHLASGLPYFKQLDTLSQLQLQYKSISSGYFKSTEFTIYLLNDFYNQGVNQNIQHIIQEYNDQNQLQNKTLTWDDFYPTIIIQDKKFNQGFSKIMLSNSTILFHKDSQVDTYNIKFSYDTQGLIKLNEAVRFYIIPHTGIQHLLQGQLIQKFSLQGQYDSFEFYAEGKHEIVIELLQCYGQSILTVSDESTNSYGAHDIQVMADHPSLYISKIESGQTDTDIQLGHMSYFLTIQNLQMSKYRIRASVYPSQTRYPYQIFDSGDYFNFGYNSKTQMLDISFDGLQCYFSCDSNIFTLVNVLYVFDSDYYSPNAAQGNAVCGDLFFQKHLQYVRYQINELESVYNNTAKGNQINHKGLTTSININQILDDNAKKLKVPEFYISLVAKALVFNKYSQRLEYFYFPFKSKTINVEWIEGERNKSSKIALIIGLVVGGVLIFALIGIFTFRWYRKSRRNISFEVHDALNTSISTQPQRALQANLNQSLEMNKYKENYSQFKDEEDQEV
ncbi:hypothetical protein ABPG74_020360 [Tetrahymena malaccensis]